MNDDLVIRPIEQLPMYVPIRRARLLLQRVVFGFSVGIPAAGAIAAPIVSYRLGFTWVEPVTFLFMLFITGIGIEAGYHRLFSHLSYKASGWARVPLAILGNMGFQGPVLYWVANHRLHHSTTDKPDDPHTPYHHPRGRVAGFIHAHVGWFFGEKRASPGRYARDLLRDRTIMLVNRLNPLWLALSLLLPAAIGGLGTWTWKGFIAGFLWGGLARVFAGQHFTYFINSYCHVWGTRPLKSGDHSGNVWWLVLPTCGAGLHNNHHAFPASATYDFRWWQIDPSGLVIRALAALGLAWDLKRPDEEQIRGAMS